MGPTLPHALRKQTAGLRRGPPRARKCCYRPPCASLHGHAHGQRAARLTSPCLLLAPSRAAHPGSKVEVGPSLDLMSQESVKAFAAAIAKREGPLNILVNNAGCGARASRGQARASLSC